MRTHRENRLPDKLAEKVKATKANVNIAANALDHTKPEWDTFDEAVCGYVEAYAKHRTAVLDAINVLGEFHGKAEGEGHALTVGDGAPVEDDAEVEAEG